MVLYTQDMGIRRPLNRGNDKESVRERGHDDGNDDNGKLPEKIDKFRRLNR